MRLRCSYQAQGSPEEMHLALYHGKYGEDHVCLHTFNTTQSHFQTDGPVRCRGQLSTGGLTVSGLRGEDTDIHRCRLEVLYPPPYLMKYGDGTIVYIPVRGQARQRLLDQPLREEEEKPGHREQELQREEKLRERHQAGFEELEREFGQESVVAILEEAIQKLQRKLEGERGEHMRELEGELKRKQEQMVWVEKEERKRKEEKEMEQRQRHKEEMEALKHHYREEARQGAEVYLKPILAILAAIIAGALIGLVAVAMIGLAGIGNITGALINPACVAGGAVGAAVGALGGMFRGRVRSRKKGKRKRRLSMSPPGNF